jgi:hypothetical protein
VGTSGDLEHGAAMITPGTGMAMRRTVSVAYHHSRQPKVVPRHHGRSTTQALDEGWDLGAFDSRPY